MAVPTTPLAHMTSTEADACTVAPKVRGKTMSRRGKSCNQVTRRWTALVVSLLLWNWMLAWAVPAEQGELRRGQQLYRHYCAACHGIEGTGTGRNAPYLEHMGRAPRDHTDGWYMNRLSDAELYRAISEGKRRDGEPPFMPWWGYTLTDEDIWNLVAFIRTLAKDVAD
jgi:mono/diheme cytochrome c family protein